DTPSPRRGFFERWIRRNPTSSMSDSASSLSVMEYSPDQYISIKDLTKTFSGRNAAVQALSAIDLDISGGEFVSVIGPSGCGKSTLMMLLAGLEPASSGNI